MKKTILMDLDGVLNSYTGNYNENYIPPIRDGAFKFLENLSKQYIIKLFTTRNSTIANEWIKDNRLENFITAVTNIKEPAYLYIDDRCINFDGNYDNLKNKIDNFKVWYR